MFGPMPILAKGWSQTEIASHLGISVDTITKVKRNMREYRDVERPEKKRGPKRKMDAGMQEVLAFFSFLIMTGPYCTYFTSTRQPEEDLKVYTRWLEQT